MQGTQATAMNFTGCQIVAGGVIKVVRYFVWEFFTTFTLFLLQVQISVVSPPVLSPISFPPGLKAGDRSQITCTVTSGDMPVYFSWLKDQMPISSSLQVDERGAEFFSMLLFKSLTAAHSGVYTCVVTNTAGKANISTELAIKGNLKSLDLRFRSVLDIKMVVNLCFFP